MPKEPATAKSGRSKGVAKLVGWLLAAALFLALVIAVANYRFPDFFTPEFDDKIPGDALLATLIVMSDEMTERWLPNDVLYPTILLDNPQHYQMGELEVVRYGVRVLRDNLSRLRTTDRIDADADAAYTNFANDPERWVLPSAEVKFGTGLKHLRQFRDRLKKKQVNIYPRGDNLIELLNQLNSLLGGVCTRLSTIPSDYSEFLSEETAGDPYTEGERSVRVDASWFEIDDQFYFAQGVAYGMRQVMLAVRSDFTEILKTKKATELIDKIIHLLGHTQWEPPYMVMNGTPGGWIPWPNDAMMLNSRLQDARQKIQSLISMVEN